jgi:hypothetical protein
MHLLWLCTEATKKGNSKRRSIADQEAMERLLGYWSDAEHRRTNLRFLVLRRIPFRSYVRRDITL